MGGKRLSIEQFRELAKKQGGECLSEKYINSKTELIFKCREGHTWSTLPQSIKRGHWCKKCSVQSTSKKLRLSIDVFRNIAKQRQGECLSDDYVNNRTHLSFRCSEGHEFKSRPDHVKAGSWCPVCRVSVSENICRKFFEGIFNEKFITERNLNWLINIDCNQMHLDGYNAKLNLAFEYQGEQHYIFKPHWHGTRENFEKLKLNDRIKKELCEAYGITLIIVPYTIAYDEMERFIREQCQLLNIEVPQIFQELNYRNFNVYSPKKLEELQKIARNRNGICLSKSYINIKTPLKWQCDKGHVWWATPESVKKGVWCQKCPKNFKIAEGHTKTQSSEQNKNQENKEDNINVKNESKNIRSFSHPYPINKPRKEDLADEDFSDPYLWFSPQVREAIQSKAETLIKQVHEGLSPLKNFSDPWEEVSIYDRSEFESDLAEVINDTSEEDIIPDQDIEPNSEISEIQDHNDTRETEINNTDEEIEDSISEQQELIEDEIRNFEQINYSENREGDLRPDNFNPILQPVYDPLSQPITELIPPPKQSPEMPSNPQDINTPQPEKQPEPQNYPQNQQEQEEVSQVPEQSQEEVGTEQYFEEISDNSNVPDIESVINEPIEEIQTPEPSVSRTEDLSDKTDNAPGDTENPDQEGSKDSPNLDEKDEDSDKDKDEKEEIKDTKDDDKDEEKEKVEKDESNDDADEEKDDEDNESSKENDDDSKEDEEESDDEGQEESNDDMDDFEEDSERGFDPTDIYDPINVIDFSELYPQIPALHSSSIDHSNDDVQIIDVDDFREPFCDIKIGREDFQERDITEVPHFTSEGFTDDLLNDEINDVDHDDYIKL